MKYLDILLGFQLEFLFLIYVDRHALHLTQSFHIAYKEQQIISFPPICHIMVHDKLLLLFIGSMTGLNGSRGGRLVMRQNIQRCRSLIDETDTEQYQLAGRLHHGNVTQHGIHELL